MQICKTHWQKLRDRIEALGLSHLVAKSGEEATKQMVEELEGSPDPKNYDPLMSCNWMIMSHAMELGGLQLMFADSSGAPKCPLCEAWEHRHDGMADHEPRITVEKFEEYWIDGPAAGALNYARELGLVPKQQ